MAKKIELLNDQQEVVHPLTSADCVIMENGETLDKVMGDGIATPTLIHEGTSFQVGVGDSNIEVVDSDVAGMTIKGQSYQNILPKPTTLIMETDEKEFKINDKIDSNIIIDDNIAEIATVKGKTIVNAVQEESASEYVALGQEVSGQGEIVVSDVRPNSVYGRTLTNLNTGEKAKTLISTTGTGQSRTYACNIVNKIPSGTKITFKLKTNTTGITGNLKAHLRVDRNTASSSDHYPTLRNYKTYPNGSYDVNLCMTAPIDIDAISIYIDENAGTIDVSDVIILVGDYTSLEIPYFEGTKHFDANLKGVTLQGQTLVNTIQEPSDYESVVIGEDLSGQSITIEQDVKGLEGMTLVNSVGKTDNFIKYSDTYYYSDTDGYIKPNTKYWYKIKNLPNNCKFCLGNGNNSTEVFFGYSVFQRESGIIETNDIIQTLNVRLWIYDTTDNTVNVNLLNSIELLFIEYQEGLENLDIPYFEGTKYFDYSTLRYVNGATLEGQTLVNVIGEKYRDCNLATNQYVTVYGMDNSYSSDSYRIKQIDLKYPLTPNKEYLIIVDVKSMENCTTLMAYTYDGTNTDYNALLRPKKIGLNVVRYTPATAITRIAYYVTHNTEEKVVFGQPMIIEYQDGMENWDIPYFEGMQSVKMPVLTTTGKNLFNMNNCYASPYNYRQNWGELEQLSPYEYKLTPNQIGGDYGMSIGQDVFLKKGHTYNVSFEYGDGNMSRFNYFNVHYTDGTDISIKAWSEGLPNTFTITPSKDVDYVWFCMVWGTTEIAVIKNIQIEEGSTATPYEPYKSNTVQIGGNLFDGQLGNNFLTDSTGEPYTGAGAGSNHKYTVQHMPCSANTEYQIHVKPDDGGYYGIIQVYYYDKDKKYLSTFQKVDTSSKVVETKVNFTTPNNSNIAYMRVRFYKPDDVTNYSKTTVSYLTIKPCVTLRAIGDVKDELDLSTGKLTQRIGEIVLDGNEHWNSDINGSGATRFYNSLCKDIYIEYGTTSSSANLICNNFNHPIGNIYTDTNNSIQVVTPNGLYFICTECSTIEEWKTWLKNNKTIIQYALATPIVKAIDLSVTDQDGNELPHPQLQTPINHITTSSDSLTPIVNIPSTVNYDTIIKPSTQYTLRFNHDEVNTDNPLTVNLGGTEQVVTSNHFTITTPSTLTHNQLQFSGKGNVVSKVQVIEGDVTGIEYPYFEGMNDVKFSDDKFIGDMMNIALDLSTLPQNNSTSANYSVNGNTVYNSTGNDGKSWDLSATCYNNLKPSTKYIFFVKNIGNNPMTVARGHTRLNLGPGTGYGIQDLQPNTKSYFTYTTSSDCAGGLMLKFIGSGAVGAEIYCSEYVEGMEQLLDECYFSCENTYENTKLMKVTGKNLVKHLLQSEYYGFSIQAVNGSSSIINGTLTENYRDYYIVGAEPNTHIKEYFNKMEVGQTIHFNSNLTDFAHYIAIGKPNGATQYYTNKYTKTSHEDVLFSMFIRFTQGCTFNNEPINIQIEEGSIATPYEPRHEIIVQQDVDYIPLTSDMFEQGVRARGMGFSMQQCPLTSNAARISSKTLIPVKPGSKYTVSGINTSVNHIWGDMYDKDGLVCYDSVLDLTGGISSGTGVFVPHDVHYLCIKVKNADESAITPSDLDSMNLILQEVPQEIVLRGIGDVKDELDLTRGEYIQRIYDYTFTGEEEWYSWPSGDFNSDDTYAFHIVAKLIDKNFPLSVIMDGAFVKDNDFIISNLLPTSQDVLVKDCSTEGIVCRNADPNYIGIKIKKDKIGNYNGQAMGAWVKSLYNNGNPLKIQFALATPIIHKVNLTNTKVIPSYATETHYETIIPSDSLIPNITIPSTLNYDVAIKPSTKYTIRANTSDNLTVDLGGTTGTLSNGKVTLTTPATLIHNEVKFSGTGKVKELMVVEGNEIKDNVPFFNGMKDVQMGGIKLVNIARGATTSALVTMNSNKTQFTYKNTREADTGHVLFDKTLLKPNTTYTIYCNITSNTINRQCKIQVGNGTDNFINIPIGYTGIIKETLTTTDYVSDAMLIYFRSSPTLGQVVVQNPMIIEGDWTHLDEIPYIESEMIVEQPIIRSQGKNLLDLETKYFNPSNVTYTKSGTTYTVVGNTSNYNYGQFAWTTADLWFRKLLGKEVTLSVSSISSTNTNSKACVQIRMECTDGSKVYKTISMNDSIKYVTFTIPSNAIDMALQLMSNNTGSPLDSESTLTISNIQLELGNTATTYKAYRHQTLYSNRVIGYEDGCYYTHDTGAKASSPSISSVTSDVEGLSIAYVTHASSNFSFWDKDGAFISGSMFLSTATNGNANSNFDKDGFIVVPPNAKYMKMACGNQNSSSALNYHLKATVTGDLPLRSLPNGVCDTLNLVTGEYVQRVGEFECNDTTKDGEISSTLVENAYSVVFYPKLIFGCDVIFDYVNQKINAERIQCEYPHFDKQRCGMYVNYNNIVLWDKTVSSVQEFKDKYWGMKVQCQISTPIVRKLEFTTKGNYREQVLDGSETWAMDAIDNSKTVRMTKKNTSPLQNPLYDTVLFTDDYHVRARDENHGTYEYIGCIGNGIYINIYQSKVNELSVKGCTQWLSHNPIKVGYITSTQSSESYSNIHKPIFFNNVNVQYLPNNVDIQPQLTFQARTRNSYVLDMAKSNTLYTVKAFSNPHNFYIDGKSFGKGTNGCITTPTLTNRLLVTGSSDVKELMIIEGDVTGKNLPYFKGILSSYHDVDEIEIYSVNKNLFDMSKVKSYDESGTYWWNTIVKESEVVSVRVGDINNGQFGAYVTLDVRPNSVYTLYMEMEKDGEPFGGQVYVYENDKVWGIAKYVAYANTTYHISTSHNAQYITIGFNYGKDFPIGTKLVAKNMRLYLGEEPINYIPHSHSTTLIEMPTRLETVKVVRPELEKGAIDNTNGEPCASANGTEIRLPFIPVQPGEIITVYNGTNFRALNVHVYDINKNFIGYIYTNGTGDLVVPDNAYFIRGFARQTNTSDLTITRQAYKPIQLNSLPNGVCDEIIMKPNSNKAQLVQRVGKVVLDGSENWSLQTDFAQQYNTVGYSVIVENGFNMNGKDDNIISETYTPYNQNYLHINDGEGITIGYGRCYIRSNVCETSANTITFKNYLQENPITVYYELATPIIHEIQLKGYPHVYENGTVAFNTDVSHKTVVSYNVDQEQLITNQNETIIRHDQQIDDLYYYIELYLEEIYQMELFRMQVELSL